MTDTELAILLSKKLLSEPSKNLKHFMRDCGADNRASDLHAAMELAESKPAIVASAQRIVAERTATAAAAERDTPVQVQQMLFQLIHQMERQSITGVELAARSGLTQPMISDYLAGRKSPGMVNLAKMAEVLGCSWVLKKNKE